MPKDQGLSDVKQLQVIQGIGKMNRMTTQAFITEQKFNGLYNVTVG